MDAECREFHDHLVSDWPRPPYWVKLSRWRVQVVSISWNGGSPRVWCRYARHAAETLGSFRHYAADPEQLARVMLLVAWLPLLV